MIKLIIAIFICLSSVATAGTDNWTISTVVKENYPVGYIYHTSALGIQKDIKTKVYTSLRFICAVNNDTPIITIFWHNGIASKEDILITASIDNKSTEPLWWANDGELLFRSMKDSPELMQALSRGKIVKFQWVTSGSASYMTSFNINGADFNMFNTKCKT